MSYISLTPKKPSKGLYPINTCECCIIRDKMKVLYISQAAC